jgi:tetratricopeptide (TPR) repeat protein
MTGWFNIRGAPLVAGPDPHRLERNVRVEYSSERWELQVGDVWAQASCRGLAETELAVKSLVEQRGPDDAASKYELASFYDFAGRESEAEVLYRDALAQGLDDARRPRAVLQLSNTLRNLGRPTESVSWLEEELAKDDHEGLSDALTAFLALALTDAGRPREAVACALHALSRHLSEYSDAVRRYATDLTHASRGTVAVPRCAGDDA